MVQSQVEAIELIALVELAQDYINQATDKPYSERSLRDWADKMGLTVISSCVNQHGASLIDKYFSQVVSVRGKRQQQLALQDFIRANKVSIKIANEFMAEPGRYVAPSLHDSLHGSLHEANGEAFHEAIDEVNEAEAVDGAIVLMQGGIAQLQQQTSQATDQFVAAVEECADRLADAVEAAPVIFANRLAQRAKSMPKMPDMSKLLGVKPRQLREGTDG